MKLSVQGVEIGPISLSRVAWLIIAVAMLWHVTYITSNGTRRDLVIGSDGGGYYAFLPAAFIYQDFAYSFCDPLSKKKVPAFGADKGLFLNTTVEGKYVNKYFIGTSVLELPFFAVASGTASWFGYRVNGYSFPFQLSIALAAIFYVLLGLDQLRRLLRKMNVSEPVQAVTLLLVFFATNLYHYTLGEPGMSHAFSFSMIALLLNQAHNVFHHQDKRALSWMLFAMAMIVMIRPLNGLAMLTLPAIAGSWKNFVGGIRFSFQNGWRLAAGAGFFLLLVFLQLLTYKLSTGKWWADSYSGEFLILSEPHIPEILFSWKKGWFIYTPLMLLAFGGVFFMQNTFTKITFLFSMFVVIYFVSCWELWWYGGSFGMRPLIDYYAFMAIPLALLLGKLTGKIKLLFAVPVFGFVFLLGLVQEYQYIQGILPYNDITAAIYSKLFFRTNQNYIYSYYPGEIEKHTLPLTARKVNTFVRTFEEKNDDLHLSFWAITDRKKVSGGFGTMIDDSLKESSGCRVILRDALPDSTLIPKGWIVVKSKVYLEENSSEAKMALIIRDDKKTYLFEARPIILQVEYTKFWQDYSYAYKIPAEASPGSEVVAWMSRGVNETTAYADDVTLEFYVTK